MSEELITYYKNLLIQQYHDKEKAQKDIEVKTKIATGDFLMLDMWKSFDVDTSVGNQLDLIGKIVGISRMVVGFNKARYYFSLNSTTEPILEPELKGFSVIGETPTSFFRSIPLESKTIYEMTDGQYRDMIKIKILYNNAKNKNKYIDDSFYNLFGENIKVTNNFDMTITFNVSPSYKLIGELAEYLNILPVPLGVGYSMNYL